MEKKIRYLVLAAQQEELNGLFENIKYDTKNEESLTYLYYENESVILYGVKSGIGKVSMTYAYSTFIAKHEVDRVINIGVAGSISNQLPKLTVFAATKCAYNDVDVTTFGYKVGQMCQMPLYFECDEDMIKKALSYKDQKIFPGLILSGDSFITNAKKEWFTDFDNPIACDMESAAVGQVSYLAKLPFMIIRAISDDVTESDNTKVYNNNLNEASFAAGKVVAHIIFD